ncbi:MAG: DUF456 domain-containing protein [Rikenellaceae bacterium]|nr:DUF456 domain-containing protein [Rikenellaceae bacterium]
METFLEIMAVLCGVVGVAGCVLPVLPGAPLTYVGCVLLALTSYHPFSWTFMIAWGVVTVVVQLADYYLPAVMTSKFGGSPYAKRGSMAGVIAGFFVLPPWGLILCPFLGAFIGELLWDRTKSKQHALKVAVGSFVAFLLGTGIKLITSSVMLYYIIKVLIEN